MEACAGERRRGGHEVDFCYWAKLAPEALDAVVEETLALVRQMY